MKTALAVLLAGLPAAAAEKKAPEPKAPEAAVVNGVSITAQQVDARAEKQLTQLRAQEYAVRERALSDLIDDELTRTEAAARGVTVEELLRAEVDAKAVPVTPEDIQATYDRFKSRFGNLPEEEARKKVLDGLAQQRREERRRALMKELRKKASVRILLEPPRVAVDIAGAPVRGPKDAPVTLVEFSDFQCPYCIRAAPTVQKLQATYGEKLRVAFRNFPLPIHAAAPKAAEAAACALEQGKFWEMHDRLFAANGKLEAADLKAYATELGLDGEAFGACLDSGRLAASWKADLEAGERYGVTGTPAFFINGRMLSGAQPYESFAALVDDEIARAGLRVPRPQAER